MAKIITRHFGFQYGPNDYLFIDRRIAIGLLAARNPDPWRHHKYRIWFSISWDWLPKFGWIDDRVTDPAFGYPSSSWTGRDYRLFDWSWQFAFSGGIERP